MKRTTLLALSLILVGAWSRDDAKGQSSAAPPVSLAPPNASPPHASARNSKPKAEPTLSGREPSPPVIGGLPPAPNPAADYDGFSVGTVEDNEPPRQMAPPMRSRAAKGSKPNPDTNGIARPQSVDQEDEALKRKLTICQACK